MPRGRRTGSLGKLERRLVELDAQRHRVIAEIRQAVARLTAGSAAPMAGPDPDAPLPVGGRRPRRASAATGARAERPPLSAEARARLSQLAKARWAKAKKAGKTRLG